MNNNSQLNYDELLDSVNSFYNEDINKLKSIKAKKSNYICSICNKIYKRKEYLKNIISFIIHVTKVSNALYSIKI